MEIAVRYFSKGGNARKLAEAIAAAVGVPAQTVEAPVAAHVDLLFLGSSVYGGGVDDALRAFISSLSPGLVGQVAVFSTSAITASAYPLIKKLLDAQGIPVSEKEFHCRGQFTILHRGRPNENDLAGAAAFAKSLAG